MITTIVRVNSLRFTNFWYRTYDQNLVGMPCVPWIIWKNIVSSKIEFSPEIHRNFWVRFTPKINQNVIPGNISEIDSPREFTLTIAVPLSLPPMKPLKIQTPLKKPPKKQPRIQQSIPLRKPIIPVKTPVKSWNAKILIRKW